MIPDKTTTVRHIIVKGQLVEDLYRLLATIQDKSDPLVIDRPETWQTLVSALIYLTETSPGDENTIFEWTAEA